MSRRSGQNGSIQKDGKWYVVRYWKDVPGQEKRVRVRAKICPISGPGKLSVSERERKAKEIIAASGVDTKEYFDRVVTQSKATVVTFRQQVEAWLAGMRNRRSKPVAPSTLSGWESGLKNWLNPNLGDLPLEAVDNLALKKLVNKMVEGGLSASTICNYADVVKMVVASVINEKGDESIRASGTMPLLTCRSSTPGNREPRVLRATLSAASWPRGSTRTGTPNATWT